MDTIEARTGGSANQTETTGEVSTYAASFGVALGITALLNAVLVVLKETNEDTVLAWMKAATGHHWVTQGLIDVVVFVALGLLLAGPAHRWRTRPGFVISWLVGGSVVGSLIITGFFV